MGGAESRAAGRLAGLLATCALVSACVPAAPKPEPLPPQAVSQHRPESTPPPPVATATPAAPTLVVVDAGEPEAAAPESLGEAARREKERRRTAEKPVAVITNTNLAQFVQGQQLTVAQDGPAEETAESVAGMDAESAEREQYWRERGLEIRRRWRDADDSVQRLEEESSGLRRQFYSTDDPYVRDNQIKPEWDRVLAELEQARRTVADAPRELESYLEEGRRAGALPGWLREGIEIEPESESEPPDSADPQEPTVFDEEAGPP